MKKPTSSIWEVYSPTTFSCDVVKMLSKKGILAVDAQGYLREVRGEKVYPVESNDKKKRLNILTY